MKKPDAPKRSSTRTVVVSKAMRTVDHATRVEVRDKRLAALEADNYAEEDLTALDEAYGDDLDGDRGDKDSSPQLSKKKKAKLNAAGVSKWALRRNKPLERIIHEQVYDTEAGTYAFRGDFFGADKSVLVVRCGRFPNVSSVNAAPSALPPRKFCSVCGLSGFYTCTRCGSKSCSIKCMTHHKESLCLRFGNM